MTELFNDSQRKAGDMGKKRAICMVPDCKRQVKIRGVCSACYGQAMAAIRNGETTEDDLISLKLILPSRQRGRKNENPMRRALNKNK